MQCILNHQAFEPMPQNLKILMNILEIPTRPSCPLPFSFHGVARALPLQWCTAATSLRFYFKLLQKHNIPVWVIQGWVILYTTTTTTETHPRRLA